MSHIMYACTIHTSRSFFPFSIFRMYIYVGFLIGSAYYIILYEWILVSQFILNFFSYNIKCNNLICMCIDVLRLYELREIYKTCMWSDIVQTNWVRNKNQAIGREKIVGSNSICTTSFQCLYAFGRVHHRIHKSNGMYDFHRLFVCSTSSCLLFYFCRVMNLAPLNRSLLSISLFYHRLPLFSCYWLILNNFFVGFFGSPWSHIAAICINYLVKV